MNVVAPRAAYARLLRRPARAAPTRPSKVRAPRAPPATARPTVLPPERALARPTGLPRRLRAAALPGVRRPNASLIAPWCELPPAPPCHRPDQPLPRPALPPDWRPGPCAAALPTGCRPTAALRRRSPRTARTTGLPQRTSRFRANLPRWRAAPPALRARAWLWRAPADPALDSRVESSSIQRASTCNESFRSEPPVPCLGGVLRTRTA